MSKENLSFQDFIVMILNVLDRSGIEYMLGGAIAVWPWGEPRSTQDVDMVIQLKAEQIDRLSAELEKVEIFLPADIIMNNLNDRRGDLPINAIHGHSGYKAEMFLMRKDDALRNIAFSRRVSVDFGDKIGNVFVHSPEDIILYKLIYYSLSQQSKHIRDIASILKIKENDLDYEYIENWAVKRELINIWDQIQNEIEP